MRARRRLLRFAVVVALALVAVAVVVAVVVRDRRAGPPRLFVEALEVMPAEPAGRGLYFTAQPGVLTSRYGFAPGQVEQAVSEAYGIRGEHITAVLESGGPASTALVGRFPVEDIAGRFRQLGYDRDARDGWAVLTGGSQARGPLAAGAEAVALRRGAMVIATPAELAALVKTSALSARWVPPLLAAVPADATAVAMGPSYDEMVGDLPGSPQGGGAPPRPAGWLIAFRGDGEERSGVVALHFDQPAGPVDAGQLAARIRALPTVGAGADALVVEPGDPQWNAERNVATVPVTAAASPLGWQQLRVRLETGQARFLRQP